MSWSPEVEAWLNGGEFDRVSAWYEDIIERDSSSGAIVSSDYYHLGLAYLLQEREEDAGATWFLALSQTEGDGINELVAILDGEAARQEDSGELGRSWLIRGHIQEIFPDDVNNILSLAILECCLKNFDSKKLPELKSLLAEIAPEKVDRLVLGRFLENIIFVNDPQIIYIIEIILDKFIDELLRAIIHENIDRVGKQNENIAIEIINVYLRKYPPSLYLLNRLAWYYVDVENYDGASHSAYKFYQLCETVAEKAFGAYLVVLIMINCGYWLEMEEAIEEYKKAFQNSLNAGQCPNFLGRDCLIGSLWAYIGDDLVENRRLGNQNGKLYQESITKKYAGEMVKFRNHKIAGEKIKIGYIGHTLKHHSIGIITRWLLEHHDQDKFGINIYLVDQTEDFITKQYFRDKSDNCYNLPDDVITIAKQIRDDNIDILIDLDSVTGWTTSAVMALKPAPVQISWLGWDAAGIPAIDYYLADNYVLPQNAQNYYREKIWRLPHSYIAIDGVEIGVPTLSREDLEISPEAVIYLTAQTAYKRNPESIRLQLQVLKAVPGSYLLVQGKGAERVIKSLFEGIAIEEGVNCERLRFLPLYPVTNYRANLGVADIILDTYPFSGGTMTLDSLWLGIPMVTKVGQQWASRNSYTLMVNAGLNEGIAWNDEEYIDWGKRLGTDRELREEVRWKLRQSRQTAPLWNARQFTKNFESAYQQMWDIYRQRTAN